MPLVSKAKGKEAEASLAHAYMLEKNFHMEKSRYSDDLLLIGYEQGVLVSDDPEKGTVNYLIEIIEAANNAEFIAPSSPIANVPTGIPFGI